MLFVQEKTIKTFLSRSKKDEGLNFQNWFSNNPFKSNNPF